MIITKKWLLPSALGFVLLIHVFHIVLQVVLSLIVIEIHGNFRRQQPSLQQRFGGNKMIDNGRFYHQIQYLWRARELWGQSFQKRSTRRKLAWRERPGWGGRQQTEGGRHAGELLDGSVRTGRSANVSAAENFNQALWSFRTLVQTFSEFLLALQAGINHSYAEFDLLRSSAFKSSNCVFKSVIKELQRSGDDPPALSSISPAGVNETTWGPVSEKWQWICHISLVILAHNWI